MTASNSITVKTIQRAGKTGLLLPVRIKLRNWLLKHGLDLTIFLIALIVIVVALWLLIPYLDIDPVRDAELLRRCGENCTLV
ncbi:MAG: hypothetical protein M0Q91_14440 [Methanoregula sp.]|jgi:hypothetical protein|nr:hypothetical protein [Methanoregula sp.]